MKTLGYRIFELRKEKGLSQKSLAEMLNISRQSISKWERDETIPDLKHLIQLTTLFNVSLDSLITTTNSEKTSQPIDSRYYFRKILIRSKKLFFLLLIFTFLLFSYYHHFTFTTLTLLSVSLIAFIIFKLLFFISKEVSHDNFKK
ncbi:helix-turn-helix transcriptional regulator [Vagococcus sp. PNs007]|uniref:Helix-turn-helix transcriptional regulator n=1 Tax=Vagococcus proximus TaxID=2991417 RepID=A0ABT5X1Y0_9ENTE|nr:helix-turn-helix transcriptional regulator [Vagococcus proximus]MDF0479891.1 helix-turn-helix transcriptional regulator [Vagococcus proximus]